MDKKKRVSVIVPVYNVQDYLSACIESILGQTYQKIELFLVDDGSTDDSLKTCREYAQRDSRVTVLTKENGGQGSARNMALDLISGEYVSFVDSDDYIKPDMLEKMVDQMELHNADLAICFIQQITRKGPGKERALPVARVYTNEELMREYVTTDNIHSGPCNKLYKKEIFLKLRFPQIRSNEDAYIMHEILGACKTAVHVGKVYYMQNVRRDSTEQKPFSESNLITLKCAQRQIEYYRMNYPDLLKFVAYKKVNKIAVLMHRILVTGVYRKYKDTYKMLEKELQEEYRKVLLQFPQSKSVSSKALQAIQHPFYFRLLNVLRGIKRKLHQ